MTKSHNTDTDAGTVTDTVAVAAAAAAAATAAAAAAAAAGINPFKKGTVPFSCCCYVAAGNRTSNAAPPCSRFAASIDPPNRSTIV